MSRACRVLVVDDSAFARKVLRETLQRAPGLEVVGIAQDGLDALEKISLLRPDVITLDLVMPQLDGLGVLRALAASPAPPRVVVVSMADGDSALVLAALSLGATDFVHKPTALANDRLYELAEELATRVRAAAEATFRAWGESAPGPALAPSSLRPPSTRLLAIGTSTGGPQALERLLLTLPADFPVAVAIVLHIPPGYTEAVAKRLDERCAVEVLEASEGLPLLPGRAVLAQAGWHLKVALGESGPVCRLDKSPASTPHRPSVDVLFESAAETLGSSVLGVVLTGMGNDGLQGARRIHERGGHVLTEAASSCVIYGMPRSVKEAGLSSGEAPLDRLLGLILARIESPKERAR